MLSIRLVLMIVGFVLLLLAACDIKTARLSLGWAGLACWLLAVMVS